MTAGEPVPPDRTGYRSGSRTLRWVGSAVLVADVALVAGLADEGSVLAQSGGSRYVIVVVLVLAAYLAATLALTSHAPWQVVIARRSGVILGLITGVMWSGNLAVETFAGLHGLLNIAATGPLLLGGFALWGIAGASTRRRSGSIATGALAAVCAAMTCVAITVAFGFALAYLALPRLEHNIDGSPEYLESEWHDLHAFAIANTLDAASTHLLIAPIIAAVLGTLGALAAGRRRNWVSRS